MQKSILVFILCLVLCACGNNEPDITRLKARVAQTSLPIKPGKHPLNLGATLFINGKFYWRDGFLYIPKDYRPEKSTPLLVWLHGGGGYAYESEYMFPIADEFGLVLLAIDSRHNTWDGIDSPFGPDVLFIDKALHYTFERVAINTEKIVLGGLSNGGSYALALGRSNGDLFTHIVAAAPWGLKPPSPPVGKPKILVTHGTKDNVYPYLHSKYVLVPELQRAGYDVTYIEFDGPHWVPEDILVQVFDWIVNTNADDESDSKPRLTTPSKQETSQTLQ